MLTVVLAESSLELVPKELASHLLVRRDADRRRKRPEQLILDRSYHHRAMLGLSNSVRRGRPDIAHITLLTALGSPLSLMGRLRVYIHTLENLVISVSPGARIPRNSERFKGLIEQLFEYRRIPSESEPLLKLTKMNLDQLIKRIAPTYRVGLTVLGEKSRPQRLATCLAEQARPSIIIGGFPRGHFSDETMRSLDATVSVYPRGLEAWTVASWMIFAYEQAAGLNNAAPTLPS